MPEPENPEKPPEPRVKKIAKIDAVRQFVQMMKDNELTALDFIDGPTQIRLRRRGPEIGSTFPAPIGHAPPANSSGPAPVPSPPAVPATLTTPSGVVIESPMVGTYYSSSSPDSPSFVAVGATIRSDTTVCIIEAMKVFTDIPAGAAIPAGLSATITEILVKNGQSVEYGQPLFRIELA